MADVAGLAISVASLATLFQSCLDCYRCVQVGKNFPVDFQTISLRLDLSQLQLSRWGKAAGLGDVDGVDSLGSFFTEEDVKKAEEVLGHIVNLFEEAEKVSAKYKSKNPDVGAVEIDEALPAPRASLRMRMRHIYQDLRKNTSGMQKTKWAIYRKGTFSDLVEEINELVSKLVEMFPAMKPAQDTLCDQEATDLRREAALPALSEVAAEQDKRLAEAIDKLGGVPSAATIHNEWKNSDNTKVNNQIGSQTTHGSTTTHM